MPCRFARQSVKRGANSSTQLDQVAFAATCRNGERQRMQMAAAIAEQRQHGPDLGADTLDQLRQAVFVGAIHLAQQLVPDRAEVVVKGFAARKHYSFSLRRGCNAIL